MRVLATVLMVAATSTGFAQTRLPEMSPEQMNPQQRAMYDAIIVSMTLNVANVLPPADAGRTLDPPKTE